MIIGLLIGALSTSLLTSRNVPVGSIIASGNVVLVTSNKVNSAINAYPSIVVDSGAVKTYVGGSGIPGGGVRLSASGSSNFVANILVPNTFASGSTLDDVRVECNGTPITTSGSIVVNQVRLKQSITTGTQLRNGIFVSTGSNVKANTGVLIQKKLTAGTYLSFITNTKSGIPLPDCVVKPSFTEKYGR